jgi:putative hemolysin
MLDIFRKSTNNLALVLDEYGSVEGIVTPRDIFAAIAGEFAEDAAEDTGIVRREDNSWSVDGRLKVTDLEKAIGATKLADEEYTTVAGLVLHRLGHLPHIGETVTYRDYAFEVADLDGRRIDRLIVKVRP